MYKTVEEQSHDYIDYLIDERENMVSFTAEFISPVRDPTRYATLKPALTEHLKTASTKMYETRKPEKEKVTPLVICKRLVAVLKKI